MNWIFTVATVLAFIIVVFILLIFMPKPKVFFDIYIEGTENFNKQHAQIEKEVKDVGDVSPVIPIFGNGAIVDTRFPVIYELLRSLPFVRYAGLINIKPKFEQVRQYGWDINSNNTIRYYYAITHSAAQKSGIWIDGQKKFFYSNEWIVGDISREHSLFNKNKKESTVVLFIDVDRCDINKGNSPNSDVSKDEVLRVFYKN